MKEGTEDEIFEAYSGYYSLADCKGLCVTYNDENCGDSCENACEGVKLDSYGCYLTH